MQVTHGARVKVLALFVLLSLAGALAAGCQSDGGSGEDADGSAAAVAEGAVALSGWVTADGPVAGASVELRDGSGTKIGEAVAETNSHGLWTARLARAPKSLRIVTSGGEDRAGPVEGELVAVEDPFTPHATLHAGPATTLLAAWLDAHSDATFDEGRRRVARFLGLPAHWDVNGDTHAPVSAFSGHELMRDARENGGLEPFVDTLLAEMNEGASRPYPGPPANQVATNPATSVGGQILKSALGVALSAMVKQAQDGGAQQDLSQIKDDLDYVYQGVTNVLSDLDAIGSALALADYDVQISGLKQTIGYAGNAFAKLKAINHAYDGDYTNPTATEIANAKNATQAFADYYMYTDVDRRQTFADGPDAIHQAMVGTGGDANVSALYLWTKAHYDYTRLWSARAQARAGHAVNYWAGVQSQLLASNYAYAALNPSPSFPVSEWRQQYPPPDQSGAWQGRFANWLQHAGLDGMKPIVPSVMSHGTVLDRATNTMWYAMANNPEPTSYDLDEVLGDAPSTRWSAPSKNQISALLGPQGSFPGWQASKRTDGASGYSSPLAWLADNGFEGFVTTKPTGCRDYAVSCTPDQRAYTTTGDDLPSGFQGDEPNCYDLDGAQRHTSNCRNKAVNLATGGVDRVCTSECPKAYRLRSTGDNPGHASWHNGINFLFQQPYRDAYAFVPNLQEAATAPQ